MKKRLDRVCKVCSHPKRNHRMVAGDKYSYTYVLCNNCHILAMYHLFELDNLKYLEEVDEQSTHRDSK